SALLVFVGLYVRLRLAETPAFQQTIEHNERVRVPMFSVIRHYPATLLLGTFAATATFLVFYLMTVFSLSWGTTSLGYARPQFLIMQMIGVLFFAATIPLSALAAERLGRLEVLIGATVAIIAFGFALGPLFGSGSFAGVLAYLCVGLALMGLTYGPLGTGLAELFATPVRYTGASLTFNLAGIIGASAAPYIATSLAQKYGLPSVGYYMSGAGIVTLIALVWIRAHRKQI
ncbi:MAG: MFS transporter, partial [Sinobacteraceae bacterium]|nr:MFS transporter [Nevskiaceae bacterium]